MVRSKGGSCVCGEEDSVGSMVRCDGAWCPYGQFHVECVGLRRVPRKSSSWLCPECSGRSRSGFKKRRYIPSDEEGSIPLKVSSAERQSRLALEEMLSISKPARFGEDGRCGEVQGLGLVTLDDDTFASLESLHQTILEKLRGRLTAWAGVGEGDERLRGYAFLPSSMGKFGKTRLAQAGLSFHSAAKHGKDAADDKAANLRSCVRLKEEDVDDEMREALESVARRVESVLADKYKSVARLECLEALQPNLHNGKDHLPPHLDHPLNDGFGVVIVTLCVAADANILIVPESQNTKPYWFHAKRKQAYILSGTARNQCDHGVVCPLASTRSSHRHSDAERSTLQGGRQSLNLRFGLHSKHKGQPFYYLDEMPALGRDEEPVVTESTTG